MRNIITLMVALGGLTAGCANDESDDDRTREPQAQQLLDAGRVGSGDAGHVGGGDASSVTSGSDAGSRALTSATAHIVGKSGNTTLTGKLVFTKAAEGAKATLEVKGVAPGPHGAHLHAKGDCSAPDATSAGDHWNPIAGSTHGAPSATSHLGDLGNLTVGADGTGKLELEHIGWALGDGSPNDVVGKAIVIHGGVDDLTTQPSGNSGPRIGCGVVVAD